MLGRTHVAIGTLTKLILIIYFGVAFLEDNLGPISFFLVLLGSYIPDFDMPGSKLANKFGFIKKDFIKNLWVFSLTLILIVSFIIFKVNIITLIILIFVLFGLTMSNKISKKGFASLKVINQIVFSIIIIIASIYYSKYEFIWISVIIISLLISKHRGFSHSILFIVLTYYGFKDVFKALNLDGYEKFILIGIIMHIFADMFTKMGVKLLYPINFSIRFPLYIKTGKKAESILFFLVMSFIVYLSIKL